MTSKTSKTSVLNAVLHLSIMGHYLDINDRKLLIENLARLMDALKSRDARYV